MGKYNLNNRNYFTVISSYDSNGKLIKGYQPIQIKVPAKCSTWKEYSIEWKSPDKAAQMLFWILKWRSHKYLGEAFLDNIEMIDMKTGKNILPNSNFTAGQKNLGWTGNKIYAVSYGNGAGKCEFVYEIYASKELLYRSAGFSAELAKKDQNLCSSFLRFGEEGVYPLSELYICAGTFEPVTLVVKSKNTNKNLLIELITPQSLRLLPPEKDADYIQPLSIVESKIEKGKMRRYLLKYSPKAFSSFEANKLNLLALPLQFAAHGCWRTAEKGFIKYRAMLENDYKETVFHLIKYQMLPPLRGKQPEALPIPLHALINSRSSVQLGIEMRNRFFRKIRNSGYNIINVVERFGVKYATENGLKAICYLPTVSISGGMPVSSYLAKHPEDAAYNFKGKKVNAICPYALLREDCVYRKELEKIIAEHVKVYPDYLAWDYEFPISKFQGRAAIGFSKRNIKAFAKLGGISGTLTPELIKKKYKKQWLNYRYGQTADICGLYNKYIKKVNSKAKFEVYSGVGESALYYGIDWKKVSPNVDNVVAGYGGNQRKMLAMLQQNYFINGTLIQNYFDQNLFFNSILNTTIAAGGFMSFPNFIVDGRFYYKSSQMAEIIANFEKLFKNTKKTYGFVNIKTGEGKIISCPRLKDKSMQVIFIANPLLKSQIISTAIP